MNSSRNASCQQLFKDLNILPIRSQYIYSILLFVTKNKDQFLFNSQVHKINTRQTLDLYVPTYLTIYQKGVYYSGIKIYSHLPTAIKDLSGDKNKFKLALKIYLLHYSFYSLEEYFNTWLTIIVTLCIITYTYFNHSTLNVSVAILWHYNKAQLMYTCFIYYAKCIHD